MHILYNLVMREVFEVIKLIVLLKYIILKNLIINLLYNLIRINKKNIKNLSTPKSNGTTL